MALFNHLVGQCEERRWNFHLNRTCGVAEYIDRLLKGTKIADLPFQAGVIAFLKGSEVRTALPSIADSGLTTPSPLPGPVAVID